MTAPSAAARVRFLAFVALAGSPALLATAAGCISVDLPPAHAARDKLRVEQVEATKGVMFGYTPGSL